VSRTPSTPSDSLLLARDLVIARGGARVIDRLSFDVGPGLTLVIGGDGRGKTTLLRAMAGTLEPASGTLCVRGTAPYAPEPNDAAHDEAVARDWLARERAAHAAWDVALEADLVEAFALREHLDKELFRLSTGSRRKLGLVAAFAAGAALALLDTPFAGLDGPSRAVLGELLADAAGHATRGWVVADHALPPSIAGVRLAGTIDLGE
jgi:ABC-type multidrug transport system ATPase subunit